MGGALEKKEENGEQGLFKEATSLGKDLKKKGGKSYYVQKPKRER